MPGSPALSAALAIAIAAAIVVLDLSGFTPQAPWNALFAVVLIIAHRDLPALAFHLLGAVALLATAVSFGIGVAVSPVPGLITMKLVVELAVLAGALAYCGIGRRQEIAAAAWEHVVDHSPDAFLIIDELGNIRRSNAEARRIYAVDASPGRRDILDTVDDRDACRFQRALDQAREHDEAQFLIAERRGCEAEQLTMHTSIFPFGRRLRQPEYFLVLVDRNVTELQALQRDLHTQQHLSVTLLAESEHHRRQARQAEDRLQQIIRHAPVGMMQVDREHRILLCNEALSRMFNWPADDLLGRDLNELIPNIFHQRHPQLVNDYLNDPHIRSMSHGRRVAGRRRDGRALTVEVSLNFVPSREGLTALASVTDVTALEQLERNFGTVYGSGSVGIVFSHADGRIQEANFAFWRMLGYEQTPEPLPDWRTLTPDEHRTASDSAAQRLLDSEAVPTFEKAYRHRDGREVPVLETITPLNSQGYCLSLIIDITAQKQYEEQLQQQSRELARSNRELEQFASVASHDLQEPLRKIQAYCDLLKHDDGDAHGIDYLERINAAAARMQQLIQDLLRFSRILMEPGDSEVVDLNRVLADVLTTLSHALDEAGAEVDAEVLPSVQGNSTHLRQLFQNLLSNAIKYRHSERPARIRICSQLDRARAQHVITVADNGIGFDAQHNARVFKPFSRLHHRQAYPGTGIGLAICQRVVEQHHGTITASARLGEGATFTVMLPADVSPSAPAST